jgi:hypothetical protein
VIPFHAAGGVAVLFATRIEGVDRPLTFTLDTGSAVSYLDRQTARSLGLIETGKGTVHGSGREPVEVGKIVGVGFELPGGLISRGYTVNTLSLRGVSPDGEALDGILGSDFIARFVVTIDYVHHVLHIAEPAGFDYRGTGVVLPVTLRGGWPFVPGTVSVGGAAETSDFFVDSGSSDAVDHPAILRSTGPVRHIHLGVGVGEGTNEGVIGHADWFALGELRMVGALTACCPPNDSQRQMLGTEILRRFTVILDYTRSRMILEPNEHFMDPFSDG